MLAIFGLLSALAYLKSNLKFMVQHGVIAALIEMTANKAWMEVKPGHKPESLAR